MLKDHEDCFTIESYTIERKYAGERRGEIAGNQIYIFSDKAMRITITVSKNI